MLELLAAARIDTKKLHANTSKIFPLKQKLQALLSQRAELKHTAQRALVSYVRSIHLHADKLVFDAGALPLNALAESMGLVACPNVKFLGTRPGKAQPQKNWAAIGRPQKSGAAEEMDREVGAAGHCRTADELDAASRDDAVEHPLTGSGVSPAAEPASPGGESDEDATGLVFGRKARQVKPRNKMMRMISRNTAERRGNGAVKTGTTPNCEVVLGPAEALLRVRRTFVPPDEGLHSLTFERQHVKKTRIRKTGSVLTNTRTVFDDDGVALDRPDGFEGIAREKGGGGTLPTDLEARVVAVRAALKATSEGDRERERERVRGKHREQKRKRNLADMESSGARA